MNLFMFNRRSPRPGWEYLSVPTHQGLLFFSTIILSEIVLSVVPQLLLIWKI